MKRFLAGLIFTLSVSSAFVTLTALFSPSLNAAPTITGADMYALPEGETLTASGTDLSGTTATSMIWGRIGRMYSATFNVVDATSLEVVMPRLLQDFRKHYLFVESSSGATLGVPSENLVEHTTVGASSFSSNFYNTVIKSGGVLTGPITNDIVVIEAGGVIQLSGSSTVPGIIVAEDGATVDFTGVTGSLNTLVLHNPGTILVGTIPNNSSGQPSAAQYTSVTPSYGVNAFTGGEAINITIVGDGTVTKTPDLPYYPLSTSVELTATTGGPNSTFIGWSGSVTSPLTTVNTTVNSSALNITATFATDWTLNLYDIAGANPTASPAQTSYSDQQTVNLSVNPDSGYTFLGWGGDASGASTSTSIVMDANKHAIPILRKDGYNLIPQITSTDIHALPSGETLTLTGTNLGAATSARMFWAPARWEFPATVNPINATTLEVVMPSLQQGFREHILLVETPTGTTVGVPTSNVFEHTFVGPGVQQISSTTTVVKAGGVLTGPSRSGLVIVETGGVIELPSGPDGPGVIFAQDGAVVDFTNVVGTLNTLVIHSPETLLIGSIPNNSVGQPVTEQVTSIAPSYGIGTFTEGFAVNVTVVGDGTISFSPDLPFYPQGAIVQLTATAGTNHTFSGWTGDTTSTETIINFSVSSDKNLTATFSAGWLLNLYNVAGANATASPELAVYADQQDITLSVSPDAGYSFLGWGGDASGATTSTNLTMDANKRAFPILRKDGYNLLPQISSSDFYTLPEGETITITGSNLNGATAARMLWAPASREFPTTIHQVDATTLEIVMPDVSQGIRDHHLMVETATGTTVAVPSTDLVEHTTVGPATNQNIFATTVVKAGAALIGNARNGVVIVETGGVIELASEPNAPGVIFAENGAIIDFTQVIGTINTLVIHSPETLLIGTIPNNSLAMPVTEQVTPIKPSYNLDTFDVGYPLNVTIDGPGAVTRNPDKTYYAPNESVNLTATEDPGAFFIRWIGGSSSNSNSISLSIREETNITARFSTAPDYFSTWRIEHFTPEELADVNISAFDADPDFDSFTNAAEYAFGTDPRSSNGNRKLKIKKVQVDGEFEFTISYPRPKDALDVTYQVLVSTDLVTWNFNGDDTDLVYSEEVSTVDLDADTEEVTLRLFPQTDSPRTFFVRISAILF